MSNYVDSVLRSCLIIAILIEVVLFVLALSFALDGKWEDFWTLAVLFIALLSIPATAIYIRHISNIGKSGDQRPPE